MKKSIIISAVALCFAINVNANPISENVNAQTVEAVFKVNPFCVSIANRRTMKTRGPNG